MLVVKPYNRENAVAYARKYAFSQNSLFANFAGIGGNCTNFVSQCIYAGSCEMNYKPTFGWYYIDSNDKSPAWTGVPYFYNFMTRREETIGPVAVESSIEQIMPGDVVQLSFREQEWNHTPVVVSVTSPQPSGILVAAHSYDADNRPLSSYQYRDIRYIHFVGVRKAE